MCVPNLGAVDHDKTADEIGSLLPGCRVGGDGKTYRQAWRKLCANLANLSPGSERERAHFRTMLEQTAIRLKADDITSLVDVLTCSEH